jgi:cell division protein ZapA
VAAASSAEGGDADAKAAQLIQKLDQALAGDDHLL